MSAFRAPAPKANNHSSRRGGRGGSMSEQAQRVDLEALRAELRLASTIGWLQIDVPELEALLAVVDAARAYVRGPEKAERIADGFDRLVHTLGPFAEAPSERRWFDAIKARRASGRAWVDRYPLPGDDPSPPPPDRAWEEVDRWNAEPAVHGSCHSGWALLPERDLEKQPPTGNPRDRARDQLADAGVVVQRQFRSDQEQIAELEAEADVLVEALHAARRDIVNVAREGQHSSERGKRALDALGRVDAALAGWEKP